MPDKHAPIGASALDALARCPGRFQAIQALPPDKRNTSSAAAEDGTRKHKLLEICNLRGCSPLGPHSPEGYSDAEREAVATIWPYFRDHPARNSGPGTKWGPEYWVEIGKGLGFEEGLFATTIDLMAVTKDTLEIIDAKFGFREVSPESLQLKAGAIGAFRTLIDDGSPTLELYPEYRQIKKVMLTIAQPTSSAPVRSVVYDIDKVFPEWMREIRALVQAALEPGARRIPGESQCRYCAAADTCQERRRVAVNTMFEAFSPEEKPVRELADLDDITLPGEDLSDYKEATTADFGPPVLEPLVSVDSVLDLAETATSQDPGEMDPEKLGRILDLAPIIEGFLKSCEKAAMARVSAGKEVPGWKLVNGQRSRAWNGDEQETEAALKSLGLGVKDVYTRKLISPAQGEKLPKIATSKVRLKKLADLWHWKDGKPMLAPAADPRPELRSASAMFETIESDPFEGLE
jgi:hypothetical protein